MTEAAAPVATPAAQAVQSVEPATSTASEPSLYDAVNAAALAEEVAKQNGDAPTEAPAEAAPEAKTDEPKEAAAEPSIADVRAAIESGDIDSVVKLLGVDAKKLTNQDWIRLRKHEKQAKSEAARRLKEIEERDNQGRKLYEQAKSELGPLVEAKQAYADGDIIRAMQLTFGDDLDAVLEKALKQKHGRDPELVKLEREQRELKAEIEAERKAKLQAQELELSRAQEQRLVGAIASELASSGDELHKLVAEDPAAVRMVYAHMMQAAHAGNQDMTIPEAVEEIRLKIKREYDLVANAKWVHHQRGASAVSTVPSGNTTERKAPAKQVSHVRASQAAVPAPIPDDPAEFGAFLRAAVNRAALGERG